MEKHLFIGENLFSWENIHRRVLIGTTYVSWFFMGNIKTMEQNLPDFNDPCCNGCMAMPGCCPCHRCRPHGAPCMIGREAQPGSTDFNGLDILIYCQPRMKKVVCKPVSQYQHCINTIAYSYIYIYISTIIHSWLVVEPPLWTILVGRMNFRRYGAKKSVHLLSTPHKYTRVCS